MTPSDPGPRASPPDSTIVIEAPRIREAPESDSATTALEEALEPLAVSLAGLELDERARRIDALMDGLGESVLPALLPVVSELPREQREPRLERLAAHDSAEVRLGALTAFARMPPGTAVRDRVLQAAVRDRSGAVALIAIEAIGNVSARERVEMLGAFVEGRLPCGLPPGGSARRAGRTLLRLGVPGRTRLGQALAALIAIPLPGRSRVARRIAELFENIERPPAAEAAFRRWRWSLSRCVAWFGSDRRERSGNLRGKHR